MRVSKGYSSTVLAEHRDTWGFIGRFDGRVQVPNVLLILVPVPIAKTSRSQKNCVPGTSFEQSIIFAEGGSHRP